MSKFLVSHKKLKKEMNILPKQNRVFISPYSPDEVLHFLACYTKERTEYNIVPDKINNLIKFYGRIYEDKNCFVITKKIQHTHSFLPLIKGKIEEIEEGTLINVEYKLLPNTLFFLIFNVIAAFLIGSLFLVIGNFGGAIICYLFVICSWFITISNFHLQAKDSHKILEETLII